MFDYLWDKKHNRSECYSNFLLADVIDAQLSEDVEINVGSCLGLTSLYSVLGLRYELNISLMYRDGSNLYDAVIGHVKNRLRVDNSVIDIENTYSLGFGFFDESIIEEKNIESLLSMVYSNISAKKLKLNDFEDAIKYSNYSIKLDSNQFDAYFIRGKANHVSGNDLDALSDFDFTQKSKQFP